MADTPKCHNCHREIEPGKEYPYHSKIFCVDCAMEIRTSRVRKAHWQYLGSIKTKYLIPSKQEVKESDTGGKGNAGSPGGR